MTTAGGDETTTAGGVWEPYLQVGVMNMITSTDADTTKAGGYEMSTTADADTTEAEGYEMSTTADSERLQLEEMN